MILLHIIGLVTYEASVFVAYWIILRLQLSFLLIMQVRKILKAEGHSIKNRILIFIEMFLSHFLAHYLGMLITILLLQLLNLRIFVYLYLVIYIVELVTFWAYRRVQMRPSNIRNAHEYGTTLGILAAAATKAFLL